MKKKTSFYFPSSVIDQTVLHPVHKPKDLLDGTSSYKDYTKSRNNRYSTPEVAQKNNILFILTIFDRDWPKKKLFPWLFPFLQPIAPSNVLHFFNAPPGLTEQQIADVRPID